MIHRAIYGSFERFIGILTEHFGGKWPFWLSPRQILVVPVMSAASDYVKEVWELLRAHEFHADMDLGGNTMNKKIRSGQLLQYNFILGRCSTFEELSTWGDMLTLPLVLGAQEMKDRTVSIRRRDAVQDGGSMQVEGLDRVVDMLKALRQSKSLQNELV